MSTYCGTGLMSYRTYRSVRHRVDVVRTFTEGSGTGIDLLSMLAPTPVHRRLSGTGIDAVRNLTKRPVPALMYRRHRSVRYRYKSLYRYPRYRYKYHTEVTEVSGTGIDVRPKLQKCRTPIIPAVCTGGMPR